MERELWPRPYHLVMEVGKTLRLTDVTFQPHIIALVFLWAALHYRPVRWACNARNWATTTLRPGTLPSPSTLSTLPSRGHRDADAGLVERSPGEDPGLIGLIDGKPLPVGGPAGSGGPLRPGGREAGQG